eukprot:6172276-Amphidinium_carterae.2
MELGEPAPQTLQLRRVAQQRWIFQQRGQKCPDNSPYAGHCFETGRNYTRVPDGQPIPYAEWERRCYKNLDLAMDLNPGPFPKPVVACNECHRFGCRAVPLGQCICCSKWGCPDHLVAPACMDGNLNHPMCRHHPELETRPGVDWTCLEVYWD